MRHIPSEIIKNTKPIDKPITNDHDTCPICFVKHTHNSLYVTCSKCYQNFDKDVLSKWLDINQTCPCCRSLWVSYDVYRNTKILLENAITNKIIQVKHKHLFPKLRNNNPIPLNKIFNGKNKKFSNRR